jgi:hypothetical protein
LTWLTEDHHEDAIRIPRSERAFQHVKTLAGKYPRTKFVSIIGDKCIPNLPDSRIPMFIVYRKGDIRNQAIAWGADRERRVEGESGFVGLLRCRGILTHTFRTGDFTGHGRCGGS